MEGPRQVAGLRAGRRPMDQRDGPGGVQPQRRRQVFDRASHIAHRQADHPALGQDRGVVGLQSMGGREVRQGPCIFPLESIGHPAMYQGAEADRGELCGGSRRRTLVKAAIARS